MVSLLAWSDLLFSAAATTGPLEPVYRSIGLFTGNGSWAFDPKSNTSNFFRILAILAPLLTALGVTELATGATGPLWVRLVCFIRRLTSPYRHPVAIFGLDHDSLSFAKALALSRDALPMIYARTPDERLLGQATRHGIPVIPSPRPLWDRARDAYFRLIGTLEPNRNETFVLPRRVEDVVSFLPNAGAQVELAAKLSRRPDGKGGFAPLRARLLVADRGVSQRLDEYLKYTHHNAGVYPRLTDLDMLAARLMLTTHKLDVLADAFCHAQIHIAIYGFGALGRAVAKEAGRHYVTRASLQKAKLRVTAIDRDPKALDVFLAEDTEIGEVLDLDVKSGVTIGNAGFSARDVAAIIPANVTAHIIAFGDTEAAFSAAASLRRWLLEPPGNLDASWRSSHQLAPIMLRAPDWTGLGRLLRSGVDHGADAPPELPDGIFAFGIRETLFSADALLSFDREEAAKRTHAAYRKSLEEIRAADPAEPSRVADSDWDEQTPQFRDSNFSVVDHLDVKARAVGYRLVDTRRQPTSGVWPPAAPLLDDLLKLEHFRWVAERRANGWRSAETRCDTVRVHHDLVDWDALTPTEQQLDHKQILAMPNIADGIGKRLAEALVIGVVGHRPDPARIDPAHVRSRLLKELKAIRVAHPDRAPVMLTALAPGTDTWAAEAALALHIPFVVPLPLPFELYREDFRPGTERAAFHALIARAEYYIELPLKFGCASELTIGTKSHPPLANHQRRAKQYALAGAYIVERAHHVIGVWDGQPSRGVGGTGEVLSWADRGTVPEEYRTPAIFRPPVRNQKKSRILPRSLAVFVPAAQQVRDGSAA